MAPRKEPLLVGDLLDFPIAKPPVPLDTLVLPDAKVGIEVEFEGWDGKSLPKKYWTVHENENSLRNNGIEFVTSGNGVVGENILLCLKCLCEEAAARKWSVGYPRAAIHVHVDVTDLSVDRGELTKFFINYLIAEHLLFGFAGRWREDCGFCVPYYSGQSDYAKIAAVLDGNNISSEQFIELTKTLHKYQALNLNSLPRFGTVEFRHLPTTFDIKRIFTWLNIILSLKKNAKVRENSPPFSADKMLRDISSLGAEEVVRSMFNDSLWACLREYFDPVKVWEAVDAAQYLRSFNSNNEDDHSRLESWNQVGKSNKFIELKKGARV
jgi:hypothetical protein